MRLRKHEQWDWLFWGELQRLAALLQHTQRRKGWKRQLQWIYLLPPYSLQQATFWCQIKNSQSTYIRSALLAQQLLQSFPLQLSTVYPHTRWVLGVRGSSQWPQNTALAHCFPLLPLTPTIPAGILVRGSRAHKWHLQGLTKQAGL